MIVMEFLDGLGGEVVDNTSVSFPDWIGTAQLDEKMTGAVDVYNSPGSIGRSGHGGALSSGAVSLACPFIFMAAPAAVERHNLAGWVPHGPAGPAR